MIRYFLEVTYVGTGYAGFQIQENAHTIQAEVEQAFQVFFRRPVELTGSSRTDAGVHALQNYFHFDWPEPIDPECLYNLNALLPGGIALRRCIQVDTEAHCRFDALSRVYEYHVYFRKDPFLEGRAYYFPYPMQKERLSQAAAVLVNYQDFLAFSKRRTQVKTTICQIPQIEWLFEEQKWVYRVEANRFLRGMVRGLVGTMLQVGRGKMDLIEFQDIIESKDAQRADFSVPPEGLYLVKVDFPSDLII